ncbi:MAG: cytochrome c3 family protein [Alphaproteobacteria bacterium]
MIAWSPKNTAVVLLGLVAVVALFAGLETALAGRVADIRNTKHNFSATSTNTVKATSESQVCVFCHTPHGASQGVTPLWNRTLSTATYSTYHSSSLEASPGDIGLNQPDGTSKLCLSCHDGTIAIGQVNVLNAQNPSTPISMQGTTGGFMPSGSYGKTTGFTRNLGTDLTNDHPISFTYNDALATSDGELQAPSTSGGTPQLIDSRAAGYRPQLPLENGKLQCTSCHDPHIKETANTGEGNIKFLRLSRIQQRVPPTTGSFVSSEDIICLACHTKAGWRPSAHAISTTAYTDTAAATREFPTGVAFSVGKAACLNCHDSHTVQGARRLLREGTTDALTGGVKAGSTGASAIEETCYQCHSATGGVLVGQNGSLPYTVPNIKSDFAKTVHMPIEAQPEVHDIGNASGVSNAGKDFIESPAKLNQRHAECTDCHNPHRVLKNKVFNGTGATTSGTHAHTAGHTNIASGALKGSWGVEPIYSSDTFGMNPTSFTIKRGDPGPVGADTTVTNTYVTREYQICFKCHSNYAYGTSPPALGITQGSTPSNTNLVTAFTNQAMEFQAPTAHQAESTPQTAALGLHRSWHPVMRNTGRTPTIRKASASNWLAPFNGTSDVGNQTMYCSDCHGSEVTGTGVVPDNNSTGTMEDGNAWGPHGSNNSFLLKAPWSTNTGLGTNTNDLCFKCHNRSLYATRGGGSSGFGGSKDPNLHSYHADKIGKMRCTWCHVAVPHGWKNKALLVNLNKVGDEDGVSPASQVRNGTTAVFNRAPYYIGAINKIKTFATSGSWSDTACGSSGAPGNNQTGRGWMRDSNENCASPP